ncbi:MAG TPA: hypothetical protein PLU67_03360 [Candidatus Kapabacteria bacterium]|nr:hypothetical protein [Candidatus Kapabacteria bacterium]
MKKYMKAIFLKDCFIESENGLIQNCKNYFITRKGNSIITYEVFNKNNFRQTGIKPIKIHYRDKAYNANNFWVTRQKPCDILEYEKNYFKKF